MELTPSTLSMTVVARFGDAVYLRLPRELQRPCGGCDCDFCRQHPELEPAWDTLAVALRPVAGRHDFSWTIHMPVAPSAAEQARLNRREVAR